MQVIIWVVSIIFALLNIVNGFMIYLWLTRQAWGL